jgi:hypothetical protein
VALLAVDTENLAADKQGSEVFPWELAVWAVWVESWVAGEGHGVSANALSCIFSLRGVVSLQHRQMGELTSKGSNCCVQIRFERKVGA